MTSNSEWEPRAVFKEVSSLAKEGKSAEALARLRAALRHGFFDAEATEKAGRTIAKLRAGGTQNEGTVRVLILGQCTTSWLATTLTALGWANGTSLDVCEGEYDNVLQELMVRAAAEPRPTVVILLPWTQRLFFDAANRSAESRIADEMSLWTQAWDLAGKQMGAKILQVGYDWVTPGALGHHLGGAATGDVSIVRQTNEALRTALPPSAYFLDLDQVAGTMGRDSFYDPRRYFWTKQPFSEAGAFLLAKHLWAGVRSLLIGPKKVLVVDLDNTLWGGVVGETGPLNVSLGETADGEAYRDFQHHVKELGKRGVVLAISSKNNEEDALAPFLQNPQMVLSTSDFAAIEANWEPKEAALRRIADTLKLGLDSFVFFDDNPAERELIRQSLPEVEVIEVPTDPAEYARALQASLCFEAVALLDADRQRSQQYQQERERRDLQQSFASMDDYLRSLAMQGIVEAVHDANLQRVGQLLTKTNQFNLTTRRHSVEDVSRMLSAPDAIGFALTLTDRFGDHGLISVMLGVPEDAAAEKTLKIDTWLMSCRVIARTVEDFFFGALVERARELGYSTLVGEYRPTKKNELVSGLYERLGFARIAEEADGTVVYRLSIAELPPLQTFVKSAAHGTP
ncbi:MAG TPA: HAD-IIIC family phosphatase [Pirellulales bacterium]|nr:HAD-IIIC family phosphatase [Pirellulales bacterium]